MSAIRTVIARAASRTRSTIPPPLPKRGLSHCTVAATAPRVLPLRAQQPIGTGVLVNLHSRQYLATNSSSSSRRSTGTTPTNHDTKPQVSPHIGFYQIYGRSLAKVFLIALGTYQALYWTWLKLETVEEEKELKEEIDRLEKKLETARGLKGAR